MVKRLKRKFRQFAGRFYNLIFGIIFSKVRFPAGDLADSPKARQISSLSFFRLMVQAPAIVLLQIAFPLKRIPLSAPFKLGISFETLFRFACKSSISFVKLRHSLSSETRLSICTGSICFFLSAF